MLNKNHRRITFLETTLSQKETDLENEIVRHKATKSVLQGTLKLTGTQQEEILKLRNENFKLKQAIQVEKMKNKNFNNGFCESPDAQSTGLKGRKYD